MSIFRRIANAITGPTDSPYEVFIKNAENCLSGLQLPLTAEQKDVIADAARGLTERFGFDYDVITMSADHPTFAKAIEARADLMQVAELASKPRTSKAAQKMFSLNGQASMFFYNFIVMRAMSQRPDAYGVRANALANRYSRVLSDFLPLR